MYEIFFDYNDSFTTDFIGAKLALFVFDLPDADRTKVLQTCRQKGSILITDTKSDFEIRIDYIKRA